MALAIPMGLIRVLTLSMLNQSPNKEKFRRLLKSTYLKSQGTRKAITSDILKADDPDSPPEDLLYTVLHGKNEVNR